MQCIQNCYMENRKEIALPYTHRSRVQGAGCRVQPRTEPAEYTVRCRACSCKQWHQRSAYAGEQSHVLATEHRIALRLGQRADDPIGQGGGRRRWHLQGAKGGGGINDATSVSREGEGEGGRA